jgi:ribosomal protein S18 acetylase RimI-like enzyme
MAVLLRKPSLDDAADLGRVHQQCWIETYSELVPPDFWEHSTEARRIGMWERMLRRSEPARRLILAEVDGSIVGFALAGTAVAREHPDSPPAETLEVRMLYVTRSHHGSGIGQQLLDAVLSPGEAAQLWVAEQNPRAQAFYRSNGFLPDGIRDPHAHEGTDLTAIRMLRPGPVSG